MSDSLLQPGETLGAVVTQPQQSTQQPDPNAGLLRAGESFGPTVQAATTPPATPEQPGFLNRMWNTSMIGQGAEAGKSIYQHRADELHAALGYMANGDINNAVKTAVKLIPFVDPKSPEMDIIKSITTQPLDNYKKAMAEERKGNVAGMNKYLAETVLPPFSSNIEAGAEDIKNKNYSGLAGDVAGAGINAALLRSGLKEKAPAVEKPGLIDRATGAASDLYDKAANAVTNAPYNAGQAVGNAAVDFASGAKDAIVGSISDIFKKSVDESASASTPQQAMASLQSLRAQVKDVLSKTDLPPDAIREVVERVEDEFAAKHTVSGASTDTTYGAFARNLGDLTSAIIDNAKERGLIGHTFFGGLVGGSMGSMVDTAMGGTTLGGGIVAGAVGGAATSGIAVLGKAAYDILTSRVNRVENGVNVIGHEGDIMGALGDRGLSPAMAKVALKDFYNDAIGNRISSITQSVLDKYPQIGTAKDAAWSAVSNKVSDALNFAVKAVKDSEFHQADPAAKTAKIIDIVSREATKAIADMPVMDSYDPASVMKSIGDRVTKALADLGIDTSRADVKESLADLQKRMQDKVDLSPLVAHHEAGHVVVADHYGVPSEYIKTGVDSGVTKYRSVNDIYRAGPEQRGVMATAGQAGAERSFPPEVAAIGTIGDKVQQFVNSPNWWAQDLAKARELLNGELADRHTGLTKLIGDNYGTKLTWDQFKHLLSGIEPTELSDKDISKLRANYTMNIAKNIIVKPAKAVAEPVARLAGNIKDTVVDWAKGVSGKVADWVSPSTARYFDPTKALSDLRNNVRESLSESGLSPEAIDKLVQNVTDRYFIETHPVSGGAQSPIESTQMWVKDLIKNAVSDPRGTFNREVVQPFRAPTGMTDVAQAATLPGNIGEDVRQAATPGQMKGGGTHSVEQWLRSNPTVSQFLSKDSPDYDIKAKAFAEQAAKEAVGTISTGAEMDTEAAGAKIQDALGSLAENIHDANIGNIQRLQASPISQTIFEADRDTSQAIKAAYRAIGEPEPVLTMNSTLADALNIRERLAPGREGVKYANPDLVNDAVAKLNTDIVNTLQKVDPTEAANFQRINVSEARVNRIVKYELFSRVMSTSPDVVFDRMLDGGPREFNEILDAVSKRDPTTINDIRQGLAQRILEKNLANGFDATKLLEATKEAKGKLGDAFNNLNTLYKGLSEMQRDWSLSEAAVAAKPHVLGSVAAKAVFALGGLIFGASSGVGLAGAAVGILAEMGIEHVGGYAAKIVAGALMEPGTVDSMRLVMRAHLGLTQHLPEKQVESAADTVVAKVEKTAKSYGWKEARKVDRIVSPERHPRPSRTTLTKRVEELEKKVTYAPSNSSSNTNKKELQPRIEAPPVSDVPEGMTHEEWLARQSRQRMKQMLPSPIKGPLSESKPPFSFKQFLASNAHQYDNPQELQAAAKEAGRQAEQAGHPVVA